MRLWVLLGGLALMVATGAAAPASACMVLAPVDASGRGPSARQIQRQMDAELRERLRRRSAETEAALAAGADLAAELATMLVPNLHPVPVEQSDCGPVREYDSAFDRFAFEPYLRGTYLAGFGDEFGWMALNYEGELFGPACNAEFRERFAAYLRARLDQRQMRAAYLFLGARWGGRDPTLSRIMRFREWRVRRPPVDWSSSYRRDIDAWVQGTDEGRAVQRLIDDFWRENGALLADNALSCPAAVRRWPEMQARLVAAIEAREPFLTGQIRSVRRR